MLTRSLVRDALRNLRRSPALTVAAVCCIAIGGVAVTAIATLVEATLLRPLPFPSPERLVRVWIDERDVDPRLSLSIPEGIDLASVGAFDAFHVTARVRAVVRLRDAAERLRGEAVTGGYFDTLGLRPSLGRFLEARDQAPGAPPAMVISHGTWLRGFGGSPSIVGSTLRTERAEYTIVGVAPRAFVGTVEDDIVEFWIPLRHYEPRALITDRSVRQSWTVARLRPGMTLAAAQSALDAVGARWRDAYPQMYERRTPRIEPLGESWRDKYRGGLGVLAAAAVVLLAVAALNVGCLLVARVLDRRRELAVRAALGAPPGALAMMLAIEAVAIVAGGGLLGAVAGPWLLDGFLALSPVALPGYLDLQPKLATFAVAVAALGAAGLLAGFVPALAGRGVGPADALKASGRGVGGRAVERRIGAALVTAEVALSLTMLVSGGLLLRVYEELTTTDVGFRREGIARLAVTFSRADAGAPESRAALYERVRSAIAAYPGVDRAGLVSLTLPPWDSSRMRVRYDGLDPSAPEGVEVGLHLADEGLLPTLGVPIVEGRNLASSDGLVAAPVAVVSRSLAELMGGVSRAIGRHVTFAGTAPTEPVGAFRIVGVAGDVAYDGLVEQDTRRYISYGNAQDPRSARLDVYVPLARFPVNIVSIAAATSGDAASLLAPLRRTLAEVTPTSAVHWTSTMTDELGTEYAPSRFYALLVAAFSCSALAVTSLGLFALLSHAAARRSGEMGIRLALGATPRQVALLLLGGGFSPLIVGALLGIVGAGWAGAAMRGLLHDVGLFDLQAFAGALTVLIAVAVLAGAIPARRAASVDPLRIMTSE